MTSKLSFTRLVQGRKHRVHQWINTESLDPLYGIQANVAYGVWSHVVDKDNSVVLLGNREDAARLVRDWSKPKAASNV